MSTVATAPTPTETVGVLEAIRSNLPSLSGAERRVADAVMADPHNVMHSSVSDIASEAGTSLSTVVRFCQRLGLRGFHALKISLARESTGRSQPLPLGVDPHDSPTAVARGVLHEAATSLLSAADAIEDGLLERAVGLLAGARRVLVVAVGTSSPLANDLAYRLKTVGIDAEAPADVHVQHVSARLLDGRDVCVAISHTGATTETVAVARTAAHAGAATIGVTSFRRSPLSEFLDVAIVGGSPETAVRVEAMASRLVHIALLDALVVALALRIGPTAQRAQDLTSDVLDEHRF